MAAPSLHSRSRRNDDDGGRHWLGTTGRSPPCRSSAARTCWILSLTIICLNALLHTSTLQLNPTEWTLDLSSTEWTSAAAGVEAGAGSIGGGGGRNPGGGTAGRSGGGRSLTSATNTDGSGSDSSGVASSTSPTFAEVPFHLTCPAKSESPSSLPPNKNVRVSLVYHVIMVHNWRSIVRDQLRTLSACGLGWMADRLLVSYVSGGDDDHEMVADLREILREYSTEIGRSDNGADGWSLVRATDRRRNDDGDGGGQDWMGEPVAFDLCTELANKSNQEQREDDETTTDVVFHFHNAGATEYQPNWKVHAKPNDEGPYSRSLYWRKYAEYFTLERPYLCLEKIVEGGAQTCGVTLRKRSGGGYAENFWAARCDYVRTLPPPLLTTAMTKTMTRTFADNDAKKKNKKKRDGANSNKGEGGGTNAWIVSSNAAQSKQADEGGIGNSRKARHVELHHTPKDRHKRLIHPEEYDRNATRFDRLACPQSLQPPRGGTPYRLVIAYHVGFLNNWREVVTDQLRTLSTCGLGKAASTFLISHSNATEDDLSELRDLIGAYDEIRAVPRLIEADSVPYEGPVMNAVHDLCVESGRSMTTSIAGSGGVGVSKGKGGSKGRSARTIVFYIHNKGVSRWTPHWRHDMDRPASDWKRTPYGFLLYWRKYMEFYTIERPALCINAILNHGAWTCGTNMRAYHYSGNIWTADCSYLSTLGRVEGRGYLAAEKWVGGGMNLTTLMQGRFVNLHESPKAGKAGYRHLMLPEEYVDEAYLAGG